MSIFKSESKTIRHNMQIIYDMLSDLSNLNRIKDRIPKDKITDFVADRDSCSMNVSGVGRLQCQIVERDVPRSIKFATENSPIPLDLWIHLQYIDMQETVVTVVCDAELNPIIKPVVSKPLQMILNSMIEFIAGIPYGQPAA